MRRLLFFSFFLLQALFAYSQNQKSDSLDIIDYSIPKEYTIADIEVTGVKYLNPTHLVSISGLRRGQKISIPGSDLSNAIQKYWRHGLFSDVRILITKIENKEVYLEIQLTEQPRLNKLRITGLKKAEIEDIKEKLALRRGIQVTDNVLNNSKIIIRKHFVKKGFFNIEIDVKQVPDTAGNNRINLWIDVKKNERVKIEEIVFEGN